MSELDVLMQGHIHTFEMSNYQEPGFPINIISGMGGTQLEDHYPAKNLEGFSVEEGVHIKKEITDQRFGYLVYTETNNQPQFEVKDTEGHIEHTCSINYSNKDFNCH